MCREELANTITHGLGLALGLVGLGALLMASIQHGSAVLVLSSAIYGASLIFTYATSTFFHGTRSPHRKSIWQLLDHVAIYLFIAGSYTPYALVVLPPRLGWTLLAIIWGVALLGILLKVRWRYRFRMASSAFYVGMGWIAVFFIGPITEALPLAALLLIVFGGVSYTVGVVFYLLDHKPFFHAIWHVFVLLGSVLHFVAVLRYVIPVA